MYETYKCVNYETLRTTGFFNKTIEPEMQAFIPVFTREDFLEYIDYLADNKIIIGEIRGYLSGLLLNALTLAERKAGISEFLVIDLHNRPFYGLFEMTKNIGSLELKNVKGDSILAFAGAYGGFVEEIKIDNSEGSYLLSFVGSYKGVCKKIEVNGSWGNELLSNAGGYEGQIDSISLNNISGKLVLKEGFIKSGQGGNIHVQDMSSDEALKNLGIKGGKVNLLFIESSRSDDNFGENIFSEKGECECLFARRIICESFCPSSFSDRGRLFQFWGIDLDCMKVCHGMGKDWGYVGDVILTDIKCETILAEAFCESGAVDSLTIWETKTRAPQIAPLQEQKGLKDRISFFLKKIFSFSNGLLPGAFKSGGRCGHLRIEKNVTPQILANTPGWNGSISFLSVYWKSFFLYIHLVARSFFTFFFTVICILFFLLVFPIWLSVFNSFLWIPAMLLILWQSPLMIKLCQTHKIGLVVPALSVRRWLKKTNQFELYLQMKEKHNENKLFKKLCQRFPVDNI